MKDKLKEYRTLKIELEDVECLINEKSLQDSVQGSSKDFPYIKQTHRIEGAPDEDYSLLVRKADIKAQIKEIESFVNDIDNKEIQTIIRMRYINSKRTPSWQSIACKLGYCSEHTPKRKFENYLSNGGNGGF